MLALLQEPWHWSFSGLMITLVMFLLLYHGKNFGVSGTMRTLCAAGGAGKQAAFFDIDWKAQGWNLWFAFGMVIGGFIAANFLQSPTPVQITPATIEHLNTLGIEMPRSIQEGTGYVPSELFGIDALLSIKGFLILVVGGFLVGFGARYAGGCTSGHAISGLSNLQLPSLISVIGFFIGGLMMTHWILPFILKF